MAGCSNTSLEKICKPAQQKRLNRQLLVKQSFSDHKEAELSRSRKAAVHQRCVGSLFSPAVKSPQYTKLLARTDRLTTETETFCECLHELNVTLAARPSTAKHVKSRRAWRVVPPKKPPPKAAHILQRKPKATAKPTTEIVSRAITLPAYETLTPVKAWTTINLSDSATSNVPKYLAPVASTLPAERGLY